MADQENVNEAFRRVDELRELHDLIQTRLTALCVRAPRATISPEAEYKALRDEMMHLLNRIFTLLAAMVAGSVLVFTRALELQSTSPRIASYLLLILCVTLAVAIILTYKMHEHIDKIRFYILVYHEPDNNSRDHSGSWHRLVAEFNKYQNRRKDLPRTHKWLFSYGDLATISALYVVLVLVAVFMVSSFPPILPGLYQADEAPKGTIFYRIVVSPDPAREDRYRDLDLSDITIHTMLKLEERLGKQIQFVATIHDGHSPHRHVHALVLLEHKLTREDFQALRLEATGRARAQRWLRDRIRGHHLGHYRTRSSRTIHRPRRSTMRRLFRAPRLYQSYTCPLCSYHQSLPSSKLGYRCPTCGLRMRRERTLELYRTQRREVGLGLSLSA